jgi:hypothetical protein
MMKLKRIFGSRKNERPKNELAGRSLAIRLYCLVCCCRSRKEVDGCPARTCWLWPWRKGSLEK